MFQPVLPLSGLGGWVFLQNTLDRQTETFNRSPEVVRDTTYFEAEIGKVSSAQELVEDRRLLSVALGAFGLDEDIDNRFLIQRVLEGGTENGSLASRLADDRYSQITEAFGFGSVAGARTSEPLFASQIVEQYQSRAFEAAIGNQDEAMRLALNADRELEALAQSTDTERTKWFQILGTPPLRTVFETALGLPSGVGQIDIDKQLEIFEEKSKTRLGIESLSDLEDPEVRETFVRNYLLRQQVNEISTLGSGSVALTLLQSVPSLV